MAIPNTSLYGALELHRSGAIGQAESAYRAILGADPDNADALHHLGIALHQQGRSDEGIAAMRRAVVIDGGSAARFNDLGNALSAAGARAEACSAFLAALDLDAADHNVWNNLGAVLSRMEQWSDAELALRRAVELAPEFGSALNNLGAVLSALGRDDEAAEAHCRAYVIPPHDGKPHRMLAIAHYRLGRIDLAALCYRAWLTEEPDNPVARHLLAACTGQEIPERASDAFLAVTFDDMAPTFEDKLVARLSYRGPEHVARLLAGCRTPGADSDVLDAGCGTGLCAPVLAPYARHLTGVDLSGGMLERARARAAYDELVEGELGAYLEGKPTAFDIVVLADTLVYFGGLAPVFTRIAGALRPGGVLVATTEAGGPPAGGRSDFGLNAGGRYWHARDYVTTTLKACGFAGIRIEDVVVRMEFGQPVPGLAFSATSAVGSGHATQLDTQAGGAA